jgi:hypothetical protein
MRASANARESRILILPAALAAELPFLPHTRSILESCAVIVDLSGPEEK